MTTCMPPWYVRLTRVCHRLGRSPEEAEDIVQDAYVRFLEYRQSQHIRNEEALPFRIVTNLAINQYHRARLLSAACESLDAIEQGSDFVDEKPGSR